VTDADTGESSGRAFRVALERITVGRQAPVPEAASRAASLADATESLTNASGTTPVSWAAWTGTQPFLKRWMSTRTGRDPLQPTGVSLPNWVRWRRAVAPLRDFGLLDAYSTLISGALPADEASDAFERGFATASRHERARATGLDDFDAAGQGRSIERYTSAARDIRAELPRAIPAQLIGRREFDQQTAQGRAGKFVAEVAKMRGRMSVRDIMTTYGDLVAEITPCVLVSPDSVARFFPAKAGLFDIVVFDEASQVRVADAVGAMGRATSVVVVGDSKQMPPTSFAEATIDDEDAEAQIEDVLARDEESILAECKQARIESRWLSWHYRSQDESLIAFSNRNYYEDRLTSFPAPAHGSVDDGVGGHGITLRRVRGTFLRSGPSKTLRTNQVEAEAIVAEIRHRFAADPTGTPSIGVVTCNAQQRTLVESMLRDAGDDRIVDALDASTDGLFVKNLENVQGDERDTILFSTAFSANDKGVLPLNFGPLTNFGGERRLNVAITRARRQVILFSSFDPGDLRAEETTSRGIRDLRAYLELAQRGAENVLATARAATSTDLHREDLAEALRARGLEVRTNVGLSDFKVDLAVSPPASRAGRPRPSSSTALAGPSAVRSPIVMPSPWRCSAGSCTGPPSNVCGCQSGSLTGRVSSTGSSRPFRRADDGAPARPARLHRSGRPGLRGSGRLHGSDAAPLEEPLRSPGRPATCSSGNHHASRSRVGDRRDGGGPQLRRRTVPAGSVDDGASSMIGLLGGCVVGVWGTLVRVLFVRPRTTPPPIVPVPAQVLFTHVPTPGSTDVWRWAMAVSAEEEERRTIEDETYVERPSDAASARAARDRYTATYCAYASAAAEMGVPRRDPAVTLDDVP